MLVRKSSNLYSKSELKKKKVKCDWRFQIHPFDDERNAEKGHGYLQVISHEKLFELVLLLHVTGLFSLRLAATVYLSDHNAQQL